MGFHRGFHSKLRHAANLSFNLPALGGLERVCVRTAGSELRSGATAERRQLWVCRISQSWVKMPRTISWDILSRPWRDFPGSYVYPGLRPGLLSAVPTGLGFSVAFSRRLLKSL